MYEIEITCNKWGANRYPSLPNWISTFSDILNEIDIDYEQKGDTFKFNKGKESEVIFTWSSNSLKAYSKLFLDRQARTISFRYCQIDSIRIEKVRDVYYLVALDYGIALNGGSLDYSNWDVS